VTGSHAGRENNEIGLERVNRKKKKRKKDRRIILQHERERRKGLTLVFSSLREKRRRKQRKLERGPPGTDRQVVVSGKQDKRRWSFGQE